MIDKTVDPDLAAFERVRALREAKAKYAERKAREAQGGRLVVAPRPAEPAPAGELSVETVAVPPPEPREAPDPLGHLRIARSGLFVVVVLALLVLWLRQRRKALST